MFRNNRVARILFPLIIIALLVVVMELVDYNKTVDDTDEGNNKRVEKITETKLSTRSLIG